VKIRSRFLIRSVAQCVAAASRLHFRTMRLEVRAVDPRTIAYD
jgi:head-tail adaptor